MVNGREINLPYTDSKETYMPQPWHVVEVRTEILNHKPVFKHICGLNSNCSCNTKEFLKWRI